MTVTGARFALDATRASLLATEPATSLAIARSRIGRIGRHLCEHTFQLSAALGIRCGTEILPSWDFEETAEFRSWWFIRHILVPFFNGSLQQDLTVSRNMLPRIKASSRDIRQCSLPGGWSMRQPGSR